MAVGFRKSRGVPATLLISPVGIKRTVHNRVLVGIDVQDVLQNIPCSISAQIEVAMVRQIQNGGFVGFRLVVEFQFVLCRSSV